MHSERVESARHVLGKRGGQIQLTLNDGVTEPQAVSMECLAFDQRDIGWFVARPVTVGAEQLADRDAVASRVELVGQDGVADVGEVDADLVGPAALGLARTRAKPRNRSSTS